MGIHSLPFIAKGCIQPILSLMEQQQLHDETTNQITFILDLFSSLIKMNQDALSGLRKALESALVNQCVRIVTIGGTREGKSSLINALVGKRVCREGHLCRETKGCEVPIQRKGLESMQSPCHSDRSALTVAGCDVR